MFTAYLIIAGIIGLIVTILDSKDNIEFKADQRRSKDIEVEDVVVGVLAGLLIGILCGIFWPVTILFFGGYFLIGALVDSANAKRKARRDGVVAVKPAEKAGVVGFFKGEK